MRPINLVLEGFGTYLNKTTIDFTKLGQQGLYLITGDTGSGKTTIFDAITYALYNEASGDLRDSSMLRTRNAPPEKKTYVDFTFELHGKTYNIVRNPSYVRPKKSGEGTTEESANVILTLPDGTTKSNARTVDSYIKDLLGIDVSQFRQIAMIAQGSFQKVLTASTLERQAIFSKLFRTEKYEQIQSRLNDECKNLKNELETNRQTLNSHISNITCDEDDPISVRLNTAKTVDVSWEEKLKIIEDVIKNDEEKENTLSKTKKDKQEKFNEVLVDVEEIKRLQDDKKLLESTKNEIEHKEELYQEFEETLAVRKEAFEENTQRLSEKSKIELELPKYAELNTKTVSFSKMEKDIKKLIDKISNADSNIKAQYEKVDAIKKEIESLKDVAVNHQKYLSDKKDSENKLTDLKSLKTKYSEVLKLEKDFKACQSNYTKAQESSEKYMTDYLSKNKAFLNGQAGILAQELKDDAPCPVCGSIHHPNPCKMCEGIPSEEELKKAKDRADKESKKAADQSIACASVKSSLENKRTDFNENFTKIFGLDSSDCEKVIEEGINETTSIIKDIEAKLIEEENNIKRKETLEKQLPGEEERVNELREEKDTNNTALEKTRTLSSETSKRIEELKSSLSFENSTVATSRISELERIIDVHKKAYQDAQNKVLKASNELATLKGSLTETENRINKNKLKDANSQEVLSKFENLKNELEVTEKEYNNVNSRLNSNKKTLEIINKYVEEYIKQEKKLTIIQTLDTTINGRPIQGRDRIKLETYAQMAYFDMVIHFANQRLNIMTNGQYTLVRRVGGNGGGAVGLDLDVIDHYTGTTRDVKTLSGGESFQASLALALGLSDEVCSTSGGIQLDTMFIDEGFGTLDHETMQKAYKALISVSQGNKLVGIISHVDYLKENVEKQIVVTKTRNEGSIVSFK